MLCQCVLLWCGLTDISHTSCELHLVDHASITVLSRPVHDMCVPPVLEFDNMSSAPPSPPQGPPNKRAKACQPHADLPLQPPPPPPLAAPPPVPPTPPPAVLPGTLSKQMLVRPPVPEPPPPVLPGCSSKSVLPTPRPLAPVLPHHAPVVQWLEWALRPPAQAARSSCACMA